MSNVLSTKTEVASDSDTKSSLGALPSYLRDVYEWAYLNPRNARLLDNEAVVNTILWGDRKSVV